MQNGREELHRPAVSYCKLPIPNSPAFTAFARGSASKAKGDYEQARQDFNEALRIDPNNAVAHYNSGNMYSQNRSV
ncbi:MAG: tetratricopeptide repeat protein [Treponema sp.]|nr:tetratricopeptide repeat protein [Treponema sp.]